MTYQKNNKGLRPFIMTYAIIFLVMFLFYFFIFLRVTSVLYASLLLIFMLISSSLSLTFQFFNFVRITKKVEYFETTTDGLSLIGNDKTTTILFWSNIQKMSFAAGTYAGTLDFIFGKNFGFYIVADNDGNTIKIPPNIEGRDDLIKEVIMNSHLQRKRTDMLRSIFSEATVLGRHSGDFDYWERSEDTTAQADIDVSPRKFSSLLDYLIATIAIIVTVTIVGFAFAFITGRL